MSCIASHRSNSEAGVSGDPTDVDRSQAKEEKRGKWGLACQENALVYFKLF